MAVKKEKPLTLSQLVKYNEKVLFPFMKENFVTKKEFEGFMEITATKDDIAEIRRDMATKTDLGKVEKDVKEIKIKLTEIGVLQ